MIVDTIHERLRDMIRQKAFDGGSSIVVSISALWCRQVAKRVADEGYNYTIVLEYPRAALVVSWGKCQEAPLLFR